MADLKCNSCQVVICETTPRYQPDRMTNPTMMRIKPQYKAHQYIDWMPDESYVMEAVSCPVCGGTFVDSRGQAALIGKSITAAEILCWAQNVQQRSVKIPPMPPVGSEAWWERTLHPYSPAEKITIEEALEKVSGILIERNVLDPTEMFELLRIATLLNMTPEEQRLELNQSKAPNEKEYCCSICEEIIVGQAKYAAHMSKHSRAGETVEEISIKKASAILNEDAG